MNLLIYNILLINVITFNEHNPSNWRYGATQKGTPALRLMRKSTCTTVHCGFLIFAGLESPPFESSPIIFGHLALLLAIKHPSDDFILRSRPNRRGGRTENFVFDSGNYLKFIIFISLNSRCFYFLTSVLAISRKSRKSVNISVIPVHVVPADISRDAGICSFANAGISRFMSFPWSFPEATFGSEQFAPAQLHVDPCVKISCVRLKPCRLGGKERVRSDYAFIEPDSSCPEIFFGTFEVPVRNPCCLYGLFHPFV